jgi:hypothetical protein
MEMTEAKIKTESLSLVEKANLMMIIDDANLTIANQFLIDCRQMRKRIGEHCDPVIEQAHKAHKAAVRQKKIFEEPVIKAEQIIMPKITKYRSDQEQKRLAEEKRLREEAERKAQEEALAQAIEAEQSGAIEIADEIMAAPVQFVAPVVKDLPKMESVSEREVWSFDVVNINLLPKEFLIVDEKAIGRVVRAMKDKTNIPGVLVKCNKTLAVRT